MATLATKMNVISCGSSSGYGSGTYGCPAKIKKAKDIWLVTAGFEFPSATDFTNAYIDGLVAAGTIIPLKNVKVIEASNTENSYNEEDGIKTLESEGLYEFVFKFSKGLHNNRILRSLSGDSSFDLMAVDSDKKLLGIESANGNVKGLTLGIHQAELMEGVLASASGQEVFRVQLTQTSEWSDYVLIESDDDFDPSVAKTLNQTRLSFVNAPANTDATITVKAVRQQDGAAFTGTDYTDFLVKVNGATKNPTAGDDSATTGTFVLTLPAPALATNDVITVDLYDNTNNKKGIYVDSIGYRSNTLSATVV